MPNKDRIQMPEIAFLQLQLYFYLFFLSNSARAPGFHYAKNYINDEKILKQLADFISRLFHLCTWDQKLTPPYLALKVGLNNLLGFLLRSKKCKSLKSSLLAFSFSSDLSHIQSSKS